MAKLESAAAAIHVSAPADLTRVEGEIMRLLPVEFQPITRRLSRAACELKNGKNVCLDVKVWGRLTRGGDVKLKGTAAGLELLVPIRYDLSVQPVGPGSASQVTGTLPIIANFSLTLDERWQPTVKLAQGFTWPQGTKLKVLAAETNIQSDIEGLLAARLNKLPPTTFANLVTDELRQRVELAWRYLHYPVALSYDRQIWLRGTPIGLRFAGLTPTAEGTQVRMAIAARLQTFVGDRPAPLPPSPLAQLGAGSEPAGGGVVLPAELGYEALVERAKANLPKVPKPPLGEVAAKDTPPQPTIGGLGFYPAGRHVAVGVHVTLPPTGSWFSTHAVAYYLATPGMKAGSSEIVLGNYELFGSGNKQAARLKELPFLLDTRFKDGLDGAVSVEAAGQLRSSLDFLRDLQALPLGKGVKLRMTPSSARVARIVPASNGLKLQIEVTGDMTVHRDGTDVASGEVKAPATP